MPPLTDAPKETRQAKRQKVLVRAFVSVGPTKRSLIGCILKDLSATGCQIVGSATDQIDETFYLWESEEALPRLCRIVWRRKRMLGAEFVIDPPGTTG